MRGLSQVRRLVASRARRIQAGPATGLRIGRTEASADYVLGVNELPVQLAVVDSLGPGGVFVDVGANVGFFSLLAARLVGPEGVVYAIEPVPANAERTRVNARRNGFANVTVIEAAAADGDGSTTLRLAAHPGGAAIAAADVPPDHAGSLEVTTVTIDSLIRSGRIRPPALIKIDVEGAELEVLAGMATTLRDVRPVVLCEVDAGDEETLAGKRDRIVGVLEAAGYTVETLERSYAADDWLVDHVLAHPGAAAQ
jgi:FkbM family methyltransferase